MFSSSTILFARDTVATEPTEMLIRAEEEIILKRKPNTNTKGPARNTCWRHHGEGKAAGQKALPCGLRTQKGSIECLFILTRTHSIHIFREIPCIKPQNDT